MGNKLKRSKTYNVQIDEETMQMLRYISYKEQLTYCTNRGTLKHIVSKEVLGNWSLYEFYAFRDKYPVDEFRPDKLPPFDKHLEYYEPYDSEEFS